MCCKMLGEDPGAQLAETELFRGDGGDLPKVGQGNEHPAPPGMQRWALSVCQHLSRKETRRQQCGDSWRAESEETGMPGMQEGWKSKCKAGNERKGLQRIREREAGRRRKGWKNYLHPCKDLQGVS